MTYAPTKFGKYQTLEEFAKFMEDELARLQQQLADIRELEVQPSFRPTQRPRTGVIVFADGTEWDPGEGRGLYIFDSTWERLALASGVPGAATWGAITGTLSDQLDLQAALDGKANTVHTHTSGDVTDFVEASQDVIGSSVVAGTGINVSYDDPSGLTTIASTVTAYTDEQAQDAAAAMLIAGTHTNLTYNYNDAGNAFDITIADVFLFNTGDTFTNQLTSAAGTAALPPFSVNGQGGMFSTGVGVINLAANTNEVIRIDGVNQRVGIGAGGFAPEELLNIRATSGNCRFLAQGNAGTIFKGHRLSADATGPAFVIAKSRGSIAAPANPNQNDTLGTLSWVGAPTTANADSWSAAIFTASVLAVTPSATARDGRLKLDLGSGSGIVNPMQWDIATISAYGGTILDSNRLFQLRTTALAGAFTGIQGKVAYFTDKEYPVYHDGTRYKKMGHTAAYQTIASDADFTLTPMTSEDVVRHTGTLTANRTITLSTTNAYPGYRFLITRTGSGAFNLSVGGLKNLIQDTWCEVVYDGAAWYLAEYGAL